MSGLSHFWLQSDDVEALRLFFCLIQSQHVGIVLDCVVLLGHNLGYEALFCMKSRGLETNLVTCLHIEFNAPFKKQNNDQKTPK